MSLKDVLTRPFREFASEGDLGVAAVFVPHYDLDATRFTDIMKVGLPADLRTSLDVLANAGKRDQLEIELKIAGAIKRIPGLDFLSDEISPIGQAYVVVAVEVARARGIDDPKIQDKFTKAQDRERRRRVRLGLD